MALFVSPHAFDCASCCWCCLCAVCVCEQIEAEKEKQLGNTAFAAKDYDKAIQHFTRCIELDPK